MTIPAQELTPGRYSEDPEYIAGRTESDHDAQTLSIYAHIDRAIHYADHAHPLRAFGYTAVVAERRLRHAIVNPAEALLAWADHDRDRRQAAAHRAANRLRDFLKGTRR